MTGLIGLCRDAAEEVFESEPSDGQHANGAEFSGKNTDGMAMLATLDSAQSRHQVPVVKAFERLSLLE
jgi:hypothetical protein